MKLFAYHGTECMWIVAAMSAEEAARSPVAHACCLFRSIWGDQIRRDVRFKMVREIAAGGLLPDRIRWADGVTPHDEHELHENQGQSAPLRGDCDLNETE